MTGITGLFLLFFRIGLFGFGGGYAMLPLIYQGILDFGYISTQEFSKIVALSQITPGPIAINAATYVGYQYAGILGAAVATLGVVMPSIILVLMVRHFIVRFRESTALSGVLTGIRPATLGLLGAAAVFLARGALLTELQPALFSILICLLVILLAVWRRIHPITLTVLAGFAGAFLIR